MAAFTRALTRALCLHHAARDYYDAPGASIERCTACGARWVTYRPGTRIRAWWAPR